MISATIISNVNRSWMLDKTPTVKKGAACCNTGNKSSVMVAPIIPGVTDMEMENILERAHEAGAREAGYVMLRLPTIIETVAPLAGLLGALTSLIGMAKNSEILAMRASGRSVFSLIGGLVLVGCVLSVMLLVIVMAPAVRKKREEAFVDGVVNDLDLVGRDVEEAQDVALRRLGHGQDAIGLPGGAPHRALGVDVRQASRQVLGEHQVNAVVNRDDRTAADRLRSCRAGWRSRRCPSRPAGTSP